MAAPVDPDSTKWELSVTRTTLLGMGLESSPEHPQPLRAVAHAVRGYIDRLGAVWVEAQLIEINQGSRGRLIFLTLRDTLAEVSVSASISAQTFDAAGPLASGQTVVAQLKPGYYPGTGRLTYACQSITPSGEGRLLARLEQRKRVLQAEGLFEPALKKRLPFLPRAVGLVTGAASAAERDVVENARRRWPAVQIVTRHALVQGPQAGEQLITAIRQLDAHPQVEVIVIARGGGSLEDLLAFSDEGVIRAVYACTTPVVSAIGHETDSPILDLVADVRASTPTDAARRVVPDVAEERTRVDQARSRLTAALARTVQREQTWLDACRSRRVLSDPTASFAVYAERILELRQRGHRAIGGSIDRERHTVDHHLARIRAMSPKATLDRGYAILVGPDGDAINSIEGLDPGDDLLATLADGQLVVEVTDIRAT